MVSVQEAAFLVRHFLSATMTTPPTIPKGAKIRFNADFWRSAVDCDALRDDSGSGLRRLCLAGARAKRGPRSNNRRFLNTLLWMALRESLA